MLNWNKAFAVRSPEKERRDFFSKRERERPFTTKRPFGLDAEKPVRQFSQNMITFGMCSILFPFYTVIFYFAIIGIEAGMGYSFSLSPFPIQRIEVLNNMILDKADYLNAMKINTTENLIECSLEEYRQRITALQNVEDVEIRKVFPGTLKIWVKERIPLFRMNMGGELIGEDGREVLVDKGYFKFPYLPILSGIDVTKDTGIQESKMQIFGQVTLWHKKFLESKSGIDAKHYHLRPEGMEVTLNEDTLLILPYTFDETLIHKLRAVMKDTKSSFQNGRVINMLFDYVFVSKDA